MNLMKVNWKLLIVCTAVPLAVGAAASLLTGGAMQTFESVVKPPLSPPAWLFPVVWTVLYALMGVSSYLIASSGKEAAEVKSALAVYAYQLTVNFLWPTFFFHFRWYLFSFLWLILLVLLVASMLREFYQISKTAAYLNVPYLIWLIFAGYLNFAIWWLN